MAELIITLTSRLSSRMRTDIRVGTSGYTYFWNPGKPSPFKWYVSQGFRTVEVNASFYRFPRESWVKAWMRDSPEDFNFSIKVHRSITHLSRLGPKSLRFWERFVETLKPMRERIVFWLFQFPENFKPTYDNLLRIKIFMKETGLKGSAVMEFRDIGWWKMRGEVEKAGVIFCSVDAPELPREILSSNKTLYLRMHGRTEWYAYNYGDEELEELAEKIKKIDAERKYVYFNNDHGMLENALKLMRMLEG